MTAPLLEMRDISKTFGPVRALSNVSLTAYGGEVHALMGENGAGKSTLMKVLSGAYRADPGGEIRIGGEPVPPGDPAASKRAGLAVIYQELSLAPNLTVAQNISLGAETARFGVVDKAADEEHCRAILLRLGVGFTPQTRVAFLSLGERQLVEIARALSAKARVIVMDEPTTSLTTRETERLFAVIRDLKREGIAIIYISHRMDEVYELADRVTVLRDSRLVGTLDREEISAERLVSMMVGRDLSTFYKKEHHARSDGAKVTLSVRGLGDGRRVHDCTFDLREGEVLALSGLVGSGRTELARLIFGADPKTTGEVWLDGRKLDIRTPSDALDAGIAYLTEDRKALGLFLDMSLRDNINIGVLDKDAGPAGLLNFRAAAQRAGKAIADFAIRAANAAVNVGSLSGGNQQKALLGRLLETQPRVVILDEPTRGVDVGAKSEIYRLIDGLVQRGLSVLMISSELPEVVGVADRALVMRDGHIVGEVRPADGEHIEQEDIMRLSTGTAGAG
jgi:ribose transport system ATP-binding protein